MQQEDFIIPIYIDTNALLDLLASIEGGFSVVEKVTTRNIDTKNRDIGVKADGGTEFGVPNVLSLLRLTLGFSANWKKANENSSEAQKERYHTYGSLFYRLREYLNENDLIKSPSQDRRMWEDIRASDFVEIHGIFRPNPLADSLNIIDRVTEIAQLTSSFGEQGSSRAQPSKKTGNRQGQQRNASKNTSMSVSDQDQSRQLQQIRAFFAGILKDIQTENVRAFVTDLTDVPDHRVVSLLYMEYLRDQTLREISHKEYRMLGKVVRKLDRGSAESIDLLTGTGLGGMGKEQLDELIELFNTMPNVNLPEVQTEIEGPALEIVPIAIYV